MNSPDTTLPSDQKDPPRSFPPAPLSRQPLNIANTALENYSFSASVDSVLNGKLDAVHSFAGIPVHSLTDLASQTPCRLLEYTDEELQKFLQPAPSTSAPLSQPVPIRDKPRH